MAIFKNIVITFIRFVLAFLPYTFPFRAPFKPLSTFHENVLGVCSRFVDTVQSRPAYAEMR